MDKHTNYERAQAILESQYVGNVEVLRAVAYALLAMVDLVREIQRKDEVING